MKSWFIAARMLFSLTILTGILYPLAVTGLAQVLFPYQANGSLIVQDENIIGSELIGQNFEGKPEYFWSRPSAVNYMQSESPEELISSGASNYSYTSERLAQLSAERAQAFQEAHQLDSLTVIPAEMLFASASGLDPHISPEAAALQVERVAQARGFAPSQVQTLVDEYTETAQFAMLGEARVNVLLLNLALDALE